MRLLAQRDHSEIELRRKLVRQQDVSVDEIEQTISYCHKHHWLDDSQFAQRYVSSRSKKGYGVQRIQKELEAKGIAREHIHHALAESKIDWNSLALCIVQRRFGRKLPSEWKEKMKVQRFLLYRGFLKEEIIAVFNDFID